MLGYMDIPHSGILTFHMLEYIGMPFAGIHGHSSFWYVVTFCFLVYIGIPYACKYSHPIYWLTSQHAGIHWSSFCLSTLPTPFIFNFGQGAMHYKWKKLLPFKVTKSRLYLNNNNLSPLSQKYRQQDEDTSPQENSSAQLTGEVQGPELVQVSEKNLSQIENVHGFVSRSHISPMKVSPSPSPRAISQMCIPSPTCSLEKRCRMA